MAGGGSKGGIVEGATDEIGFHAVENRHYVTDVHAKILRQLGLNSQELEIPGRKRLDIDQGRVIESIISCNLLISAAPSTCGLPVAITPT